MKPPFKPPRKRIRILVCLLSTHPLVLPALESLLGPLRSRSVARQLRILPTTDIHRLPFPALPAYVVDSHSTGPATEGLVAAIRNRRRTARVIVLMEEIGNSHSFPLLRLGIKGLIPYRDAAGQLAKAVRLVVSGGIWIPRAVMSEYLDLLHNKRSVPLPPATGKHLSRREKEVLELLLKSLSNKEIASSLHISESTVKFHVSNIFNRFGVQRRADLILQSVQETGTIH